MTRPNSGKAKFASQLLFNSGGLSGTPASMGTLAEEPVVLFFINDSNVSVIITDDPAVNGLTLAAGRAVVLDCRANNGLSQFFTFSKGTEFFISGSAGTGNITISNIYALPV